MKNGLLGILTKLSKKKDAVTWSFLTGAARRFKALPANGKRWKKDERPVNVEITYIGTYEDAMELFKGKQSERVALIVWVPRKEFQEMVEAGEERG